MSSTTASPPAARMYFLISSVMPAYSSRSQVFSANSVLLTLMNLASSTSRFLTPRLLCPSPICATSSSTAAGRCNNDNTVAHLSTTLPDQSAQWVPKRRMRPCVNSQALWNSGLNPRCTSTCRTVCTGTRPCASAQRSRTVRSINPDQSKVSQPSLLRYGPAHSSNSSLANQRMSLRTPVKAVSTASNVAACPSGAPKPSLDRRSWARIRSHRNSSLCRARNHTGSICLSSCRTRSRVTPRLRPTCASVRPSRTRCLNISIWRGPTTVCKSSRLRFRSATSAARSTRLHSSNLHRVCHK